MARYLTCWLPVVLSLPPGGIVWAQPPPGAPPLRYELMINGESFLIEANHLHRLQSRQQPGVTYEVALRVAPMQSMKLGSVQFEYDRLSKVEDNRRPVGRSARLNHELGFSMVITDLGKPLQPKAQQQALDALVEQVGKTLQKTRPEKLQQGKPHTRKFGGASGRGVVIRYRDAEELGHTCLVYVLVGEKFAVSCLVEYLDRDSEDVLPLVKKTLESFRAVD